ncbi:hypothetical protein F5141DRAFT_527838 [Pisolithus sp. B1]|nr:hypothetical protein F5141DRAFT_527838 [Pisolithus sp. B1]
MPLPASTPSTYSHSHSNLTPSDHQLPPPSHTSNESVSSTLSFSLNLCSSLSASSMGQVVSRPPVNTAFPSSSTPPCLGSSSSATGGRFKRAFGRRKKSDIILPSSITSPTSANVKASSSSNDSLYGTVHSAPARQHGAKQLTLQLASHVFSRKQSGSLPASPATSPPPLPPKHSAPYPTPQHSPSSENIDKRVSVLTTSSSSIAPALDYIRHADASTEPEDVKKDAETFEPKEIRRKSDSTLSHHTIRPVLGGKTPRPVSLAESFQSNHTIVPVNKRLSALLTDAEYATPEEPERVEGFRNSPGGSTSPDNQGSPTVSLKARDRRSHSLNLGSPFSLMSSPPTAAQASVSLDVIPPSVSRSVPEESIKTTGPSPFMLKSVIPLHASASHATQNSPAAERTLPEIPQTQQGPPLVPSANTGFPTFRQTAISMTSGLVPAAGLARRAVEKMGRVWGSKSPPPNPSMSSAVASPSSPIGMVYRTSSGHSEPASRRKNRHMPQTPSISSTGSSMSDHEGPQLGRCLRGPINTLSTGAGMGGLVFGRDLKACVKDTALDTIRHSLHGCASTTSSNDTAVRRKGPWASLEERHLPALIVRCTQHILTWGVQEQGLFRVSGRSSHIVKLRAEFDTGADFDITQSSPGDLDPHAVASVFKAYLRELPEPILTNDLLPFFDAAMASERSAKHVPDALSGARVGMRKPPSLSTLATPSFTGIPPSDSLRKVLSSLIARLPQENRDLLLTVTEVVKLTAQRSHETKMPLSNLLLVLCPSLSMNPTLLQALCECEGIWDGWETSVGAPAINSADPQLVKGKVTGDSSAAAPTDAISLFNEKQRFIRPLPKVPVDDADLPHAPTDPTTTPHSIYPLAPASCSLIHAELSETSPSLASDDGLSLVSRSGRPTTPNSMNVKLIDPYSPPSLSSSAESLSVPSLSSASPSQSAKNLQLADDLTTPLSSTLAHSPIIAEPIPLPLTPSNTTLQPQFQFPSAGENIRKSPLLHKKSFSSSISGEVRAGAIGSRAKRMKKPSLHLLFSGRSGSPASTKSIHGNNASTPQEALSSSPSDSSPAVSMVTAPQSSRFSYPPVLDTPIDESSISLTLGVHNQEAQSDVTPPKETSSTLQETDTEAEPTKKYFPQLDLPLPDGDECGETWAQSVLLAAGESRW